MAGGRYWPGSTISPVWKGGGTLSNACVMLSWIMDLGRGVRGIGRDWRWGGGAGGDEGWEEGVRSEGG